MFTKTAVFLLALARNAFGQRTTSAMFQISFPQALKVEGGYINSEAMFGTPNYGGAINAELIYAVSDGCSDLAGTVAYPKSSTDWGENPFILMIDRGDCTFATKVREAQSKGAAAVVIADNQCFCSDTTCKADMGVSECEHSLPLLADDGSAGDITIPAVMIKKLDADKVKGMMIQGTKVLATMSWDLPAPDDVVEWDLWTSSSDPDALRFKEEFHATIKRLGRSQTFRPRYYLLDGWRLGCDLGDECGHQCVGGGRYCLPDPDGDMDVGISGADVVTENLRQMCIWEQAEQVDPHVGEMWWGYIDATTNLNCATPDTFSDISCRERAMMAVGINTEVVAACMRSDGGLTGENSRLDQLLTDVMANGVLVLPEVFVNGVHMRGHVSPYSVLSTICSGYLQGTEPEVCECVEGDPFATQECVHGRTSVAGGMSGSTVTFLIAIVLGVMCGGMFMYWKKTRENMRDQVRGILAEYMPLDDTNDGPLLGHGISYDKNENF